MSGDYNYAANLNNPNLSPGQCDAAAKARGTHCTCGAPLVVSGDPLRDDSGQPVCGAGWDTAARMWADGWRHGPPADRITLTLDAGRVQQLADTLRGWLQHRRERWLPAENEVRRLRGEPPLTDQPDLFGAGDVA